MRTLEEWLAWQSTLHPTAMDLGLDRVRAVHASMGAPSPAKTVVTVGGTNGKGSCVRYLEEMLRSAGYRVGAYTSPHLERYNERVRIDGREADDAALCEAFARVDAARGDTSLTYFEFGTLAAFDIFARAALDVAILEVGLGGRLDAVNIIDADCGVVTNVALDHMDWLGPDRESIGREKAGIYRAGRPAICGEPAPPASLVAHAGAIGADLRVAGRDYAWQADGARWTYTKGGADRCELPLPAMPGEFQLANAAAALAALDALGIAVDAAAIRAGLAAACVPGRFELRPEVATILDVAHNQAAATALAAQLRRTRGTGRTLAVLGMLRDKAADEVAAALAPEVDQWFLADLPGERGLAASALQARIAGAVAAGRITLVAAPADAWRLARQAAAPEDRIVVCGSFLTVGAVRTALDS
ncbi:MAG TPA: bifunctional tetrahydrofolate synthase/dihydrofolate synthase [Gammaproteobacteria bacterium]|nr:bifunctional tetrahydrofolate synthase/dihydrofolate synthase [Gammaproteobacteria bacterium]